MKIGIETKYDIGDVVYVLKGVWGESDKTFVPLMVRINGVFLEKSPLSFYAAEVDSDGEVRWYCEALYSFCGDEFASLVNERSIFPTLEGARKAADIANKINERENHGTKRT